MTSERDPISAASGQEGRYSSALRHELLTPLNHIQGFSEMLLEEVEGEAAVCLQQIHKTGKRLLSLIRDDLFDPAKAGQTTDICDQVRAWIGHIAEQCEGLLEDLAEPGRTAWEQDLNHIKTAAGNLLKVVNATPAFAPVVGRVAWSTADALEVERDLAETAQPAEVPERRARPGASPEPNGAAAYGPLLVVDDNENNRDMLSRRLERLGYTVRIAEHGQAALDMMGSAKFDLVLLDVMMPGLNGYEVLQRMKSNAATRDIPVIMISALTEIESIVRCIELGAEDYLPKPFDPVLLKARVGASLEKKRLRDQEIVHLQQIEKYNFHLKELVAEQVRDISRAQVGTIFALSNLAESRDPETGEHLERVQEYCFTLARELARREKYADVVTPTYIETLVAASPLHDIGKVGIPDHILQKPGKLTDEEFEIMKTHTTLGASTLRAVDEKHPGNGFIRMGMEIVESHHEKWDGSGYPHGRSGEAIPLSGRIVALADVYDALRSQRCYKPPFPHEKSRDIILEGRGKHFDPDIVDCFLETERAFEVVWTRLNRDNQ